MRRGVREEWRTCVVRNTSQPFRCQSQIASLRSVSATTGMLFLPRVVSVLRNVATVSRRMLCSFSRPDEHVSGGGVALWWHPNHGIVIQSRDIVVTHVGGLALEGNEATGSGKRGSGLRSEEFRNFSFLHFTFTLCDLLCNGNDVSTERESKSKDEN